MSLREELHRHRDAVLAIAARHGVSNVRLFGSVVRGEERPDSDIDLHTPASLGRHFREKVQREAQVRNAGPTAA